MDQNIVIYTVHKAASSLLFTVLRGISENHNIPFYSQNFGEGPFSIPDTRQNNVCFEIEFEHQPCLVGPVRRPSSFAGLKSPKRMVHLRDPRDIMTSMFFSWAYSHSGIADEKRQAWIDMGIDRFVLENHGDIRERFQIYCDWLENQDDILFSAYEDLYADYKGWVFTLMDFLGVEDEPLAQKIAVRSDPRKIAELGEDPSRHTRQGLPGDYLRKLAPDTIEELTDSFSFYFDFLERR